MKVPNFIIENPTPRQLVEFHDEVIKAINGGIEFGTFKTGTVNINGAWVTGVTPGVINTDFTLTHNLGRVPTGWLLVWKDNYVDFKIGAGVWNNRQIFLQANATLVNYRVFIF